MPIVTWCDEYNVNVEKIDIQHKKMLELVNKLHSSVEERLDKQELERLLIELVEFTRMHFTTENQLMKKYDYPEFVKHQNEHNLLLQHLDNLVTAVSRGKYPTFYSDYDISSDWALVHISEFDKPLAVFLNSKNIY